MSFSFKPILAFRQVFAAFYLPLILAGCTPPLVKPDALDEVELRKRLPAGSLRHAGGANERSLIPGPGWLTGVKPQEKLILIGVIGEEDHTFGALLEIDMDKGRLCYLPLPAEDTPISILADPERLAALRKLTVAWPEKRGHYTGTSIRNIPIKEIDRRLITPIPPPKQIFAVAANYPSHLFIDISLPARPELISRLRRARPRLFQKYPPVAAPGEHFMGQNPYSELPGPFGKVAAPAHVLVPTLGGKNISVSGHLDYEVEVAVLIGRDLKWDEARSMSDVELRKVVAGYLLFSDAKVRDPQVMAKILEAYREEEAIPDNPYRIGDAALDGTLGIWDETTCHWWSYAASWGSYAAAGPFLVASSGNDAFPSRMIIAARSYSSSDTRRVSPPKRVLQDQLLLRQAAVTTLAEDYPDSLIWGLAAILRSLLDPEGNALAFAGRSPELHAGDLIGLGTPGGTVISSKPWWILPTAEDVLFWKTPEDFYDMFFSPTEGYYLHPGDELFLWGEGLGYQLLQVHNPNID